MTQYPLVYLDHVQKLYGKHTALYDVSVNILVVLLVCLVQTEVGKRPLLN